MLKAVMVHGQTLRIFSKLMAGISLAVCLTGCGKTNKADSPQTTHAWTTKKVASTKAKTISDWVNKPGKRTKINVYSSVPEVAGAVATANMKSGYANRIYKFKSPAILDNYYFSYIPNAGAKTNHSEHVVFKSANINGVQISKDSGSFNNAVIYVSKSMIANENKLAKKAFSVSKSMMAKEKAEEKAAEEKASEEKGKTSKGKNKTSKEKSKTSKGKATEKTSEEKNDTNDFDTYNKDKEEALNAYNKYRDDLYNKLLKALGLAASNNSYKMADVK